MRTIANVHNQQDEFLHPFWLGILLLFSVITIIGIFCCLRIKCRPQLRTLCNRLFGRNDTKNETSISEEKCSTMNSSYNWPSRYNSVKSQSPKLYTLVKNMQTTNLDKQTSLKQQGSGEDANENEIHVVEKMDSSRVAVLSPSSSSNDRSSEIARKFYASMRHNSQCENSSSLESYTNDSLSLIDTPRFFQSIPDTDELTLTL